MRGGLSLVVGNGYSEGAYVSKGGQIKMLGRQIEEEFKFGL